MVDKGRAVRKRVGSKNINFLSTVNKNTFHENNEKITKEATLRGGTNVSRILSTWC